MDRREGVSLRISSVEHVVYPSEEKTQTTSVVDKAPSVAPPFGYRTIAPKPSKETTREKYNEGQFSQKKHTKIRGREYAQKTRDREKELIAKYKQNVSALKSKDNVEKNADDTCYTVVNAIDHFKSYRSQKYKEIVDQYRDRWECLRMLCVVPMKFFLKKYKSCLIKLL